MRRTNTGAQFIDGKQRQAHVSGYFFAGLIALLSATTTQAAGAWSDTAVLPQLRQRGWQYTVAPLQPSANTPQVHGQITRVYWRYHYETWQRGFHATLCARNVCVDASTERGWSDAFAGLPGGSTFRFDFAVTGRGMLTREMRGGKLHLIVNYQ